MSLRPQVRSEAQRVAVLAATLTGPAAVLALLPRTLNTKLLQQLTEDISACRCTHYVVGVSLTPKSAVAFRTYAAIGLNQTEQTMSHTAPGSPELDHAGSKCHRGYSPSTSAHSDPHRCTGKAAAQSPAAPKLRQSSHSAAVSSTTGRAAPPPKPRQSSFAAAAPELPADRQIDGVHSRYPEAGGYAGVPRGGDAAPASPTQPSNAAPALRSLPRLDADSPASTSGEQYVAR